MSPVSSEIRRAAHFWSARLDEGDLTADERCSLDTWLEADPVHTAALARAEVLWQRMSEIDYPQGLAQSALANRPIDSEPSEAPYSSWWQRFSDALAASLGRVVAASATIAAAAAIFIALDLPADSLFGPAPADQPVQFATERGSMKTINLPDGSRITLDAASQLSLLDGEDKREVRLIEGNALFAVPPDRQRPFTVEAGAARILVTGTRFDVRQDGDETFIGVAEGTVNVRQASDPVSDTGDTASDSTIALRAGEAVTLTKDQGFGEIADFFPGEFAAWQTGTMIYAETTLAEIVEDANRYAAEPIAVDPAIRKLRLSGSFDIKNTDQFLASLEAGLPVQVRSSEGQRVIVPAR